MTMGITQGADKVSSHAVRTPANIVTMLRIALAPVLVYVIYMYAPAWWVLAFGFVAMITDRVDGVLARRYGTSALGTYLDPLADKIMVLGALFVLVVNDVIWWLPVAIIALREVAMSYWRSYLIRKGVSVKARPLAKKKTLSQSITVALAITPGVASDFSWLLNISLWLSVGLTVVTFLQYVFDNRPKVPEKTTA